MRIVYCIDSINRIGGIQRATVTKANALAALPGNEVWVIVADNSGESFFPLSPEIHFVDLGVNYYEDDWKSRWNVIKGLLIKRRIHRKRLAEHLHGIDPDVVVSVGLSEKFFLPRIKGKWVTVREFHFTRDYRRRTARCLFDKVTAIAGDMVDRCSALRLYDRIVVLTREDRDTNWRKQDGVVVIPNPSVFRPGERSSLVAKRVISVGRLSYQKNYTSLTRAYSAVAERYPDWRLDILGGGEEYQTIASEIERLGLVGKVNLMGNSREIARELTSSSIFVMSSWFEGLPMAMIEAMSCGLPVVSYSCPCGPKDIIRDGVDGYLVPQGDEKALAERICRLIADKERRDAMGRAAFEASGRYDLPSVTNEWMTLFEALTSGKR